MRSQRIAMFGLLVLVAIAACAKAGSYVFTTDQSPFVPGTQNLGYLMRPDADPTFGPADMEHGEISVFADFDSSFEARTYLTFDLSSLVDSIASARIKIHQADTRVDSGDRFDLAFYSVETDADVLNNLTEFDWEIFDDLGGGTLYRNVHMLDAALFEGSPPPDSIYFNEQEVSRVLEISLNADAVADINKARGGYFSIAMRTPYPGTVFGGAEQYGPPQLVLSTHPIPLPPALWSGGAIMALGLAGYAARLKRRGGGALSA